MQVITTKAALNKACTEVRAAAKANREAGAYAHRREVMIGNTAATLIPQSGDLVVYVFTDRRISRKEAEALLA